MRTNPAADAASHGQGPWALGAAAAMAAIAWFLRPIVARGTPARAAVPEPVVAQGPRPRPIPDSVLVGMEDALSEMARELVPPPAAPSLPVPTPLGARVVSALGESEPLRKCDIARLVGIGRGSANRIVDRLVDAGWLREQGVGLFVVA